MNTPNVTPPQTPSGLSPMNAKRGAGSVQAAAQAGSGSPMGFAGLLQAEQEDLKSMDPETVIEGSSGTAHQKKRSESRKESPEGGDVGTIPVVNAAVPPQTDAPKVPDLATPDAQQSASIQEVGSQLASSSGAEVGGAGASGQSDVDASIFKDGVDSLTESAGVQATPDAFTDGMLGIEKAVTESVPGGETSFKPNAGANANPLSQPQFPGQHVDLSASNAPISSTVKALGKHAKLPSVRSDTGDVGALPSALPGSDADAKAALTSFRSTLSLRGMDPGSASVVGMQAQVEEFEFNLHTMEDRWVDLPSEGQTLSDQGVARDGWMLGSHSEHSAPEGITRDAVPSDGTGLPSAMAETGEEALQHLKAWAAHASQRVQLSWRDQQLGGLEMRVSVAREGQVDISLKAQNQDAAQNLAQHGGVDLAQRMDRNGLSLQNFQVQGPQEGAAMSGSGAGFSSPNGDGGSQQFSGSSPQAGQVPQSAHRAQGAGREEHANPAVPRRSSPTGALDLFA